MDKAFVLSDIHGCYSQLEQLLAYWDKEMTLYILGDLIDRGEDSLKVVQAVMKLKEEYGDRVVVLKGNHEDLLLRFLDDPVDYSYLYFINGGNKAVYDFTRDDDLISKDVVDIADLVRGVAMKEIEFLRNLPLYAEFGDVIFVHAGVNMQLDDWRKTNEEDFFWTREMVSQKNMIEKTIVFGHTPTQALHQNGENHDIWISEENKYIGIDGGCVFGGQLNGIVITGQGEIVARYYVK